MYKDWPSTLGLFLTNIQNIFKISLDKYVDMGSSCWTPLSGLKYFVVFCL